MKIFQSVFLIILIVSLIPDIISAQKICLSPAGKDNNPGTVGNPLATLNAACDKSMEDMKKLASFDPVIAEKFDKTVDLIEVKNYKK